MTDDKRPSDAGDPSRAPAPDRTSDSPKRQGDKYSIAVGDRSGGEPPLDDGGSPGQETPADSPKRHGDKLENARDAAAGKRKGT